MLIINVRRSGIAVSSSMAHPDQFSPEDGGLFLEMYFNLKEKKYDYEAALERKREARKKRDLAHLEKSKFQN